MMPQPPSMGGMPVGGQQPQQGSADPQFLQMMMAMAAQKKGAKGRKGGGKKHGRATKASRRGRGARRR